MHTTIVNPPAEGKTRNTFECPVCSSNSMKKLSQAEVFLAGEYPAPQVEVRRCKSCGALSERDKYIENIRHMRGLI